MASDKSGLKKLYVFLGVILGVGIALCWYHFAWVASRRDYFRRRDFRQLATLSGQIQTKIDNFDNIMDHSWGSIKDWSGEKRAAYFTNVGSDLEYQDKDDLPLNVRGMPANDPPSLAIERDEGDYFLFFALATPDLKNSGPAPTLYTRSSVEKLISPLATPLRSTFEAILVARRDGTVIFQQPAQSTVINLGGLQRAAPGEGNIDARTLSKAASSTDVILAGVTYTLYSQPIRLSYPSVPNKVEPADEAVLQGGLRGSNKAEDTRTEGKELSRAKSNETPSVPAVEEWIVCGLVQSDRFARDSQAISLTAVLGFAVVLIFLLSLTPFIKLSLIRAKERLWARDGVMLAMCTLLGAALFTLVVLDADYYGFRFHRELDDQLKGVARSMQDNLNEEEDAIWKQLDEFDNPANGSSLADDLRAIRKGISLRVPSTAAEAATRSCHPQPVDGKTPYVCERTNILGSQARGYPYLNSVFWDDTEGRQRVKWTYKKQVTPFLTESDMPYFPGIRTEASWLEKNYDRRKARAKLPPVRGIDSIYSVNSGKNITIYWKLEEPNDQNTLGGGDGLLSASLVTRPASLIGPVLPADYRFAVVNEDGLVLFHSDPAKNLIENFFAECDNNGKLRSLVSERGSGFLNAYYAGRRQRVYVFPLQHQIDGAVAPDAGPGALKGDSRWSLVVFGDMLPAETMNSEALTASSILFLLCAGILVVAWALLHAGWRRYPGKWFWPAEKKAAVYRLVTLCNGLVSALFGVLILQARPRTAVLAGFLIPALALAVTFLVVNYGDGGRAGCERPRVEPENRSAPGQEPGASGSLALAWQRLLGFVNRIEGPRWEVAYVWAQVSLLIVVALLPCVAFFRVSFEFERMLLIHRGQQRLIRSREERRERVRSEYQSIALTEDNQDRLLAEASENPPAVRTPVWLALGRTGEPSQRRDASPDCFGEDLQRLLAAASPPYNDVARETESLILGNGGAERWGCASAPDRRSPPIASTADRQDLDSPLPSRFSWALSGLGWGDWGGWFGLTACVAALFLLVRAGDKVFLLGLDRAAPVPSDPEFFDAVEEFKGKVSAGNEKARQEIADFFQNECSPTPELRAIGREFVSHLSDKGEVSEEDVVLGVRALADRYYGTLWEALSKDEKLVLAQLAHEGLINPKSRTLVAQLMKSGLIVRDLSFRLLNRSFTCFVISALPPHTMNEWEAEGVHLPWKTLRNAFLAVAAGLGIFLYVTQQSLFQNVSAYLAAVVAAIPALVNFAGIFRRSPAGGGRAG